MLFLISLVTLLISIQPEETSGIVVAHFDNTIQTGTLRHKAYIKFYQLDEKGQLKLIEKATFRENIVKSVEKIDFEKPVGINYYVVVEKVKILGPYYTLFINEASHCQFEVVVMDNSTYIKIVKRTGNEDDEIRLVEGFHIGKDFNSF